MIDRAPQVVSLSIDFHKHLIAVAAPMAKAAHSVDVLAFDICHKQRTNFAPPEPHCFMPGSEHIVSKVSRWSDKTNCNYSKHREIRGNLENGGASGRDFELL
ncbi:MAG: hypothetical protein ABJK59_04780 [Erythrobacter sp.]|uniref:hypothetical protein n=1 Tax=Erythrobacter sp. TaxID=1042 RepID=UPI003297A259